VEAGLAWLAAEQDSRGFWYGAAGAKGGDRGGSNYRIERSVAVQQMRGEGHIGVTAFAGMAFLAGGHLPNRGKYGEVVARALDYVLAHVSESGFITDSGTRMYSHALATLFLAEVYGMSPSKRIRKGLEDAIHIIVDGQNAEGGWRYYLFSRDSDLSVTVCQLQALRAARNIGIQVPRSTIDRAVTYVRRSQVSGGRTDGLYYYKITSGGGGGRNGNRKDDHFAINAAAVTALVSAGIYDERLLARPVDFLLRRMRDEIVQFTHHFQFWYGNYYACQALFHADGVVRENAFRKYYEVMKDHLISDQKPDGRWINDVGPGDVFSTAVACVVLQVPKQYLPIFQR
jgi:squalene cyclase